MQHTLKAASSRDRLEKALALIADPKGEGARTCLTVYREQAQAAAQAAGMHGRVPAFRLGPLDGKIVSIKGFVLTFAGEVTRAGSAKCWLRRVSPLWRTPPLCNGCALLAR